MSSRWHCCLILPAPEDRQVDACFKFTVQPDAIHPRLYVEPHRSAGHTLYQFRPVIQEREILLVRKQPMPPALGQLVHQAEPL